MQFTFPLNDVKLEMCREIKEIKKTLYVDEFYRLNQHEFSMNVEGVGSFYASGGNYISLEVEPDATKENIELYLNGSTYGAILHQRKIMPLHGSCFVYNKKGIMLCGHSGAGKSSLTAAFVFDGNEFLTDDISPILFLEDQPFIWTMSDRIKLWKDSLVQMNRDNKNLNQIDPETEKFYFPINSHPESMFHLDIIFLIETYQESDVKFQEIEGAEKVIALRNEIYRLEYIQGMPENEAVYFKNLVELSKKVRVIKLWRPEEIPIKKMQQFLENKINQL